MPEKSPKSGSTSTGRTPFWPLTLLRAGLREMSGQLVLRAYRALWRTGRWLFSPRGLAVTCFGLVTGIIALLSIFDRALRDEQAEAVSSDDAKIIKAVPDPVLATIDGESLRLSDVAEFARQDNRLFEESLTPQQAFDRGLVDLAIDQSLATSKAREEQLHRESGIASKLKTAERRILYAELLQRAIAEEATADNAREIYNAQRETLSLGDEVRLRRLVVGTVGEATDLSNALREGADFQELVQGFSVDERFKAVGGDMGYLAAEQMPDGYADVAFSTRRGQVSLPFQTPDGWVILKVEGRRSISLPSFEQSKEDILDFLAERAVADRLRELRAEADVVLFEPTEREISVPTEEADTEALPVAPKP